MEGGGAVASATSGGGATTTQSQSGISDVIAKHYNEQETMSLSERKTSRIFYMRNFNNWIKSMLIGDTTETLRDNRPDGASVNVLDIGCGKGGDLLKWEKASVSHMICADIAEASIEQCKDRFKNLQKRSYHNRYASGSKFTMEAITADCTKENLKIKYENPNISLDIVSCQFAFHYCFESLPQAECMLRNISECLKVGGYFMGTTVDSLELMKRWKRSSDGSFGNSVYRVDMKTEMPPPLFGAQYNFHLEGVVDCPEFIVHFPTLERLAELYGLKLVHKKRFDECFNEHKNSERGRQLLGKIQALETYPPFHDTKLTGAEDRDYIDAQKFIDKKKREEQSSNSDRYRDPRIGTISTAEWEAISLYVVFLFQKVKPVCEAQLTSVGKVSETEKSDGTAGNEPMKATKRKRNEDDTTETKVKLHKPESAGGGT